ncbi:mitochondrial-processing peptidase subunit alpha-like [Raphidocelis subcapitata]|uniref:Mitochondrial-processing peptidase subunit alpha-like n=1 Tax=Raphidocelis subcapitata TaxID=307507 RepID=A0A2V0PS90_9CHLO|nr:mitochondrial-processing peptidase subunit alpha-like [Raphidocelis subcapitata]|eukprot:GBG00196.1 mitochondrial-processing peptidase subunit alpha-like [Raphidocelis subcapitata]
MLPSAIKQLAPLLADVAGSFASGQAVAQYAVPAVATKGGLFGGKRVTVPMSEPLPGVDVPKYSAPAPAKLETGSIEGVKAAAVDTGGPNVALAVFVGSGSANETPETAGASKLLEYMAFSATNNRSTFRLTRELEKYGAAAAALAGRESIAYGVEGTKLQAAEVTEMLLDAVLNMRLNYWEINDMLPHVQADMERAYAQPTALATELLHRAAFSGGLAQPLLPDPETLASLTPEAVHAFVAEHFTAANITLAAAGATLPAVTNAAAPLIAAAARPGGGGGAAGATGKYTGGVLCALSPATVPVVALAYAAPGGLGDAKATALAAVIKALLNETREVLPYMHKEPSGALGSVIPIVHVYKSTGLIGLLGTPSEKGAPAAVDSMSARFEALAKGVAEPALAAAKGVALGGYQAATATKSGAVQELAQQLLTRGKASTGDYAAAVAGITAADVSAAVGAMLKGAPTLVAAGPLSELPKYDAVAKRFAS